MKKRQKKKTLSKSANLKKSISIVVDGKVIAESLIPYFRQSLPIDDKLGGNQQ